MVKGSKGQKKSEDRNEGLLPAVDGLGLENKKI